MSPELHKTLTDLSRRLADDGKLIEAGFVGLRLAAIPADAPQVQIDFGRDCFMAGAQHLFSSIMTILDSDREPTDADLRRLSLIADELETFGAGLEARITTKGRA